MWSFESHLLVLILLTFHSLAAIQSGAGRVPAYFAINHRIDYRFDDERGYQVPVIGDEAPLFGRKLSEAEAEKLVDVGKLTVQAKNCMNCHTLLGNGAYYAPPWPPWWWCSWWCRPGPARRAASGRQRRPGVHRGAAGGDRHRCMAAFFYGKGNRDRAAIRLKSMGQQ